MVKKWPLWLVIGAIVVAMLIVISAPGSAYAGGRTAQTPTVTPTPLPAAKIGSNAHLAIGALVLVVIILFGVGLNFWRKK